MPHCGYRYTKLGQLKIFTRTNRNSFCLRDPERLVLMFILDRTIGWDKVWELISLRQFANGVSRRKNGHTRLVLGGTGLTADEVGQALAYLRAQGAIELGLLGPKFAYKINEQWCHPDLRKLNMWEVAESDYIYEEDATDDEQSLLSKRKLLHRLRSVTVDNVSDVSHRRYLDREFRS